MIEKDIIRQRMSKLKINSGLKPRERLMTKCHGGNSTPWL